MTTKFRKRPVVISAIQYHGDDRDNPAANRLCYCSINPASACPHLHTLEGVMTVSPGDWVITGIKGERYPCKPDIFLATYEAEKETLKSPPKIITMCGSTRFTAQMLDEAWRLTKLENIVIHWNILNSREAFAHGAEREGGDIKEIIDRLYLHKVAMADEIRVINVGGYIGDSTRSELRHAKKLGKPITWLEPELVDKEFA